MSNGAEDGQGGSEVSATGLGQIVARGATFLFLAQLASAIIGLVGSIILVRLLVSPSIYAPITLAITVPGLVMLGDASGVSASLTRFLSEYKRTRDSNAIWSSFWTGFAVKAVTGLVLSAVAYFAAAPIASLVGKSTVLPYFLIAAPLPFVWVTQVNVKSVLLSLDEPRAYSLLQVLNEILLSAAPILAVLVGLGAEGALTYMVYANFAYLIVAYAYTLTVVLSVTRKSERRFEFFTTVRKMVAFGAPIGFSNSYNGFAGQVVNLTVARFVNLNTYGLYSVATTASGFISYVSDPIKTMLLPAYSRIAGLKDSNLMKMLSIQTTRYESAIILPVTLFFMVFAGPFVTSLYGAQYADAGIMLTLIAATFLPIGLGFDAMSTFLTSGGFTRFIGGVGVVSSSTIMLIAVLVVPWFGLLGFLVASIFNFILPYALVTSKARRELGLSPPVTQVRHFYSSLVLTGMASGAIILLPLPSFASVLIGLGVVPFCFVAFSALLRAIEPADFDRLRSMISTQSAVPRLIGPLIEVSERLVRFLRGE